MKFMTRLIIIPVISLLVSLGTAFAFEKDVLYIDTGKTKHRFQIEVARSPQERAQGLMFRTELGLEQGMLFDFGKVEPVAMWMKNTLIPLDMLFINADGTIVNIQHRAEPKTLVPRRSEGPVLGVLELQGGAAQLLGIRPGHIIHHSIFGNDLK